MSSVDATLAVPPEAAAPEPGDRPRSLGRDAWEDLRKNPVVLVCVAVIFVLVLMAVLPGLFTHSDPHLCKLSNTRKGPSSQAWFGFDQQGCDIYSRTIHGARASIAVGVLSTVGVTLIGGTVGMLAGFYGGIWDTIVSRTADVFFAIPFLLGAIIVLTTFPSGNAHSFWLPVSKVVLALTLFGWPSLARIMRATTLQVKEADYVAAARALGASTPRILRVHVLPNAVQPVIVYATIALGGFVGAEATLSFLGVGLQPPSISWGIDISAAEPLVRVSPHIMMFPVLFLSVTVLAFILLGDAVRDALDPKQR
ncbi:MAG TPA: ABC transporter permease [Sporichthyaceae bacterium]|jgi:oligopeptide transport system permease protein